MPVRWAHVLLRGWCSRPCTTHSTSYKVPSLSTSRLGSVLHFASRCLHSAYNYFGILNGITYGAALVFQKNVASRATRSLGLDVSPPNQMPASLAEAWVAAFAAMRTMSVSMAYSTRKPSWQPPTHFASRSSMPNQHRYLAMYDGGCRRDSMIGKGLGEVSCDISFLRLFFVFSAQVAPREDGLCGLRCIAVS